MNAAYFAIGSIIIILVIFWGSTDPEPTRLTAFFGQRKQQKPVVKGADASKEKRRW